TGEATGLLRELGRFVKMDRTVKSPSAKETYDRTLALFKDYNAVGITAIGDRGAGGAALDRYQEMLSKGDLPLRVMCSHTFSTGGMWRTVEQSIDRVIEHPLCKGDDRLRIIGTKVWLDGGMLTG